MADVFDKFTEQARKVLQRAQEEAQRLNHSDVGTEHLLLGLIRERDGLAGRVLNGLGASLPKVRAQVEFVIGRGELPTPPEVGLTPRAKRVIELAIAEARRLRHRVIGSEHLLLGILREGEGIGIGVLESMGIAPARIREALERVMAGGAPPAAGKAEPPSWPDLGTPQGRAEDQLPWWSGTPVDAARDAGGWLRRLPRERPEVVELAKLAALGLIWVELRRIAGRLPKW